MATYPIDAYALRKKLVDKYGLRLDLDGQEVLKGVIAEIRRMPMLKVYHNSKLSIGDLRHLPDGKWVWIERIDQQGNWPSAYYQKEQDFTGGGHSAAATQIIPSPSITGISATPGWHTSSNRRRGMPNGKANHHSGRMIPAIPAKIKPRPGKL